MQEIKRFPLLDEILEPWKNIIGNDFVCYKNHIVRVLNYCLYFYETTDEELKKLIIAGVHHDIGLWRGRSIEGDYISSSLEALHDYLEEENLLNWEPELSLIIKEHHEIEPYTDIDYPLVEIFRRGDLIDFSLGKIHFNVEKEFIEKLNKEISNKGFNGFLWKISEKEKELSNEPLIKI